jgi:uncharacterized RDD family membrane protein YckC
MVRVDIEQRRCQKAACSDAAERGSVVVLALSATTGARMQAKPLPPLAMNGIARVGRIASVVLLFAWRESGGRRGTLGKRICGLRLVHLGGGEVSFLRAMARSAIRFLPWHIAHSSLMRIPGWPFEPEAFGPAPVAGLALSRILVIWIAGICIAPGRTPYDRLTRTSVVRVNDGAAHGTAR